MQASINYRPEIGVFHGLLEFIITAVIRLCQCSKILNAQKIPKTRRDHENCAYKLPNHPEIGLLEFIITAIT